MQKSYTGVIVAGNTISIALNGLQTYLVVTQIQISGAGATLDIVSATSSIFRITNIKSNDAITLTHNGLDLTIASSSAGMCQYYVYKLVK